MTKYLYIILFLFIYNCTFAQKMENNYLGIINTKNNLVMSFSLHFNKKNNTIKGYSLTNINTENETKSEISGIYFKSDRSYQITEKNIIYTKSKIDSTNFCYITLNIKYQNKFSKKNLKGTFLGTKLNGEKCAFGNVVLTKEKTVKKKIKKLEKKRKNDKVITKQNKKEKLESYTLKKGENLSLSWNENKIKIKVWDDNKEDGDQIKICINNKTVLKSYTTKKEKKEFIYKLKKNQNIIKITSLSSGTNPPNTSKIEIYDNEKKYLINTNLEEKEEIYIYLN